MSDDKEYITMGELEKKIEEKKRKTNDPKNMVMVRGDLGEVGCVKGNADEELRLDGGHISFQGLTFTGKFKIDVGSGRISFLDCTFSKVAFAQDSNLRRTEFKSCNMYDSVVFDNCKLQSARFYGRRDKNSPNNLTNISFEKCTLHSAKFVNPEKPDEFAENLSTKSFKSADLMSCNLPSYMNFEALLKRHEDASKICKNVLTIMTSSLVTILLSIAINFTSQLAGEEGKATLKLFLYGDIDNADVFFVSVLFYMVFFFLYFINTASIAKEKYFELPEVFPEGTERISVVYPWMYNYFLEKGYWFKSLLVGAVSFGLPIITIVFSLLALKCPNYLRLALSNLF